MDPTSIPARMNIGRLYEQYFNDVSRYTKSMIEDILGTKDLENANVDKIYEAYDLMLGLLKILGTAQYDKYLSQRDNLSSMKYILQDVVNKELYLYYTVDTDRKPYQVTRAIRKELKFSIYNPARTRVKFRSNGKEFISEDKIRIAPIYTILLNKTPDHMLSVNSAKTNHFGIPIGLSNNSRDRLPYRSSPVKNISETETRLFASYGDSLAMLAELKHRANSPTTHDAVVKAILTAPQPTNIKLLVDREQNPYGDDTATMFVDKVLNVSGVSLAYTPERN